MITRKTIKLWSEKEAAIVVWDLAFETEEDEAGNTRDVLVATHGEEIQRISPNATDEDLYRMQKESMIAHMDFD